MPRAKTVKAWCFTLNNYTEEEEKQLLSLVEMKSVSYLIYGREVGAQGTPHLQGYLELPIRKSLRGVKRLLGLERVHLEERRGSQEQAIIYCKKEHDFIEKGEKMRQGERKDLDVIREEIKEGVSELEIAERHFGKWVVYRRSFAAYRELLRENDARVVPEVVVYWGPTGTGKTRKVYEEEKAQDIWTWGGDRWFDGYRGHPVALFDDFRGELKFGMLLRVLDRYPIRVPVKSNFTMFNPRRIYITSNVEPGEWYVMGESVAPLLRRLTTVVHME